MESGKRNFNLSRWDLVAVLICVAVACAICWKIISHGLIYAADDIWWHVLWLKEFAEELNEGILYPRWLAHCNYLYGSPVFVFYPPLCFYVGALIQKITQLSSMNTTTALFTLGTFSSGVSFYFCGRQRFGKVAALTGAIFLMTAPFVTLDIYFRASLAELCALTWLPLVLYGVDRVNDRPGRNLLSFGFCMLGLTHIPSLLIYFTAWFARLAFRTIGTNGGGSRLRQNLLHCSLGLGCASFFLLPVVMEGRFVNLAAVLDRLPWQVNLIFAPDYRGFFPIPDIAIKSTVIALVLFVAIVGIVRRHKRGWLDLKEPAFWAFTAGMTFFLMTDASAWIWQNVSGMQYLQFPWRLMTINIFCSSTLFAMCVKVAQKAKLKPHMKFMMSALLIAFVTQQSSIDYFLTKYRSGLDKPEAYMTMDSRALRVDEFARYEMPKLVASNEGYPGPPEYTPLTGTTGNGTARRLARVSSGQPLLTLIDGAGTVKVTMLKSYEHLFTTEANDHLTFKMRTFYYPAWHLYMDGKSAELRQASDGQMLVHAPAGRHQFSLRYEYTGAFVIGLIFSALSFIILVWLTFKPADAKACI